MFDDKKKFTEDIPETAIDEAAWEDDDDVEGFVSFEDTDESNVTNVEAIDFDDEED